jgi:hypothetical protein
MTEVTFNAETFAADKRAFGNAMRNAEGKGDSFARVSLAALITEALSPLTLAVSVYDEFEPKGANGKPSEPKESEKAACGVSVSSLRSARGGEGARSTLEAIFYVFDNMSVDSEAVTDFVLNKRGAFKLFPLKKHLQAVKAAAARDAAKALGGDEGEPKEGMEADGEPTLAERIEALALEIADADVSLLADDDADKALAAMLDAVKGVYDRLAAAETLRTGTNG